MTISSAILALSPYMYWKLDETTGTTAIDSGSAGKPGTASGDFAWGSTGPEIGTTGIRLFASSSIISPGIGSLSTTTWSLMYFATAPGNANQTTATNIMGLGDFANPTLRGIRVQLQSASANTLAYTLRGTTANASAINATAPVPYWHHICWTVQTTPSVATLPYLDGTVGASTAGLGTVWSSIDPFYIVGNSAIVLAHVAIFARVLTQTEIQSVANQIQPWPYYIPGNQLPGGGGGGGGGLTTDQAAQLSDIDTKTDALPAMQTDIGTLLSNWSNYTGVTLPSLQDTLDALAAQSTGIQNTLNGWVSGVWTDVTNLLGEVKDSVTTTITNATGTISTGIGTLLAERSHDAFGIFNPTGGITCDPIAWNIGGAAYWGLQITITTRPLHFWPQTPDNDWTVADLAVLRIFAGEKMILRTGIHTTTYALQPLPNLMRLGVADVGIPIAPPNYVIRVDWAPGVCGTLELQYLPITPPSTFGFAVGTDEHQR